MGILLFIFSVQNCFFDDGEDEEDDDGNCNERGKNFSLTTT